MKKQHIYSALFLTVVLASGCAKEIENKLDKRNSTAIELSSVCTGPMTKAVITGATFTSEEANAGIGLFLLDGNGDTYVNNGSNVKYAFSSTEAKWTAADPLSVGGAAGFLYGYYPFNSSVKDIASIPVESSVNGTDYLYASPVNVTSSNAKDVSLTLNHALARVSLSFKLDESYAGNGSLSGVSLSGDCVAAKGTMNAIDGGIDATASKFTASGLDQTISKTASTTVECLVVPVSVTGTPELKVACTIDGKAYATTFTGNIAALAQGKQTTINLTVRNTSIVVDATSVHVWDENGDQNDTVGGQYTVTIVYSSDAGIKDDVWIQNVIAGENSAVVTARSISGRRLKCTMADGELCTSQSKTKDMIYTFTISNITENTTAIIGYANSVSIAVSPANAGTVKVEGEAFEGETVKLKATSKEGYVFVNWQDQNGSILCESTEYSPRLSSKVKITAIFQNLCSLKVFVHPSFAGSVSTFDKWYYKGTEISVTTTPCGDSVFKGWTDKDGNNLTDNNTYTYTFTIESDTILIADYSVEYDTNALPGIFSVAADNGYGKSKKVRFSKGNLWHGIAGFDMRVPTFNFEDKQDDYPDSHNPAHIGHFFWCQDESMAIAWHVDEDFINDGSEDDILFTNATAETAKSDFTVNGVTGRYRTLSSREWQYLFDAPGRMVYGKPCYTLTAGGITIDGRTCHGVFLYPDEYNGEVVSNNSMTWAQINAAGIVFLPAAGYNDGHQLEYSEIFAAGGYGIYWSSNPYGFDEAYNLLIRESDGLDAYHHSPRDIAHSVRLVTDVE